MSAHATTDEQIAAQVLKVPEMFGFLIDRYEAKLDRYIMRKTNVNKDVRQDILQEVFVKSYENIASFDSRQSFNSWIYRICHNTIVNDWKKNKRYREGVPFDSPSGEFLEHMFAEDYINFDLENEEDQGVIADAVQDLPSKYKDIITLRFYEELSYDEISDVLEMSPGTVATNISRAKKKLLSSLEQIIR